MDTKYFGTDGIRGQVGKAHINPEFFLKLGWALGCVLTSENNASGLVLIGKDTRTSGYMFESVLQAGLSAAGVHIGLTGPIPTPAMAYLTRTLHARAAIIISASHNSFLDNGLKFFSSNGRKLPDDVELNIESLLETPMTTVSPDKLGKAIRIYDAAPRYIEFCKSTIPLGTSLAEFKIVLDCANGATYFVAPHVFSELGAEVIVINDKPNGININLESGSTHPESLRAAVLEHRADLGIAFDGDGDRVIMVDNEGNIIDGDDILYVITLSRLYTGESLSSVVGTEMSNLGLELALNDLNIELVRAPVGDRHVLELMEKHNTVLGGESSGHIICLDKTIAGDGIVSALQVLEAMLLFDKSLRELVENIKKYPQVLINVPLNNETPLISDRKLHSIIEQARERLDKKARLLVRKSGTEPVLRIMLEGEDRSEIARQADELKHLIQDV